MPGWVKICGITSVSDAELVARAGADAIGLNFVSSSPRCIGPRIARQIADSVRGTLELVGIVAVDAHMDADGLGRLIDEVGLDRVQLHGEGVSELARALGAKAFEAHAIGGAEDVTRARGAAGTPLLVDARAQGVLGGSGTAFDWSLVVELARQRDVILAGGLTPDNVGAAIARVHPWGVDVASGVETVDRRVKDPDKVAHFVRNARAAWGELA